MSQSIKKNSNNKLAFQAGSGAGAGSGGRAQLAGCSVFAPLSVSVPEAVGSPMCVPVCTPDTLRWVPGSWLGL